MRRALNSIALLGLLACYTLALLMPSKAHAQNGLRFLPSTVLKLDNCTSNGSTNVTVPKGEYLLQTRGELVYLCEGTAPSVPACASGGTWFLPNTQIKVFYDEDKQIACRSSGNGFAQWVKTNPN